MGERGSPGGAWGARDEASWWPGNGGELQHQQLQEDVARSTAAATHQLFSYKMAGGFSTSTAAPGGEGSSPAYDYRLMTGAVSRSGDTSMQQPWWYSTASIDSQQQSPSPTEQLSPQSQSGQSSSSQQQNQQSMHQQGQQALRQQQQQQQQNHSLQQQQQTLQQTLQQNQQQQVLQQQQQQQSLQQSLQQSQQQTLQQALQQQAQQALQQHQTLQEHIQAVQQQHIQAALKQAVQQHQPTLQELQQQVQQQALLQQQALIAQAAAGKRMPRGRADNKPRGRMTAYAFFVQTCREEHKKKHPDENVIFAAFSKKCAERWSTMLDKEKQRFHEMAEQDKKRYDLEMQSYVPPKGEKIGRGRKRKQFKDPNAPKRSLSAFFWFCNDERSKVKGENPEYGMGDIAKELGRRWAACNPETKSKYEQLSEKDKARYDREMTAYKKKPLMPPVQLHEEEEELGHEVEEDEYE